MSSASPPSVAATATPTLRPQTLAATARHGVAWAGQRSGQEGPNDVIQRPGYPRNHRRTGRSAYLGEHLGDGTADQHIDMVLDEEFHSQHKRARGKLYLGSCLLLAILDIKQDEGAGGVEDR